MPDTNYTDFTGGIRGVPGRTDSSGTSVAHLSAREDALVNEVLTEGVVKPDGAFEPSKGSGDFDVDLGSGTADADLFVVESQVTGQAPYIVQLQATSVTVTLDAADADPRVDEVYLVVFDEGRDSNAAGLTLPRISYRKGDSASEPDAPGPDSEWEAWALLASIPVPGGASEIVAGDITDERAHANLTVQSVSGMEVFTPSSSPMTFTVPPGVTKLRATVVGGGGGGGGRPVGSGAAGGGGGAETRLFVFDVTPGETLDIVVGAGGSGGAVGENDGDDGESSRIRRDGSLVDLKAIASNGGGGLWQGAGGFGATTPSTGGTGMGSGGGDGGDGSAPLSGHGGASSLGGGGGGISDVGPGRGGQAWGSGGAGATGDASNGNAGGDGQAGVVIIEW